MKHLIIITFVISHLFLSTWATAHMVSETDPAHTSLHVHVHAELDYHDASSDGQATDSAGGDHDESAHAHLLYQIGNRSHTCPVPAHYAQPGELRWADLSCYSSPPVPPPNT